MDAKEFKQWKRDVRRGKIRVLINAGMERRARDIRLQWKHWIRAHRYSGAATRWELPEITMYPRLKKHLDESDNC